MDKTKSSADKAFLIAALAKDDAAMVRIGGNGNDILSLLTSLNEGVARSLMNHGIKATDAVALLQVATEEGSRRAFSGRRRKEQWQ